MASPLTAVNMIQAVGRDALLTTEKLQVGVRIVDARQSYGQPQVLVTPLNGTGQQWVTLSRITVIDSNRLSAH